MEITENLQGFKSEPYPPGPCCECGSKTWKNGKRSIKGKDPEGPKEERQMIRCSQKDCPHRNRTLYEFTAYPQRQFHLDEIVTVVEARLKGELRYVVAQTYHCSGSSIYRWMHWISGLVPDIKTMEQFCVRMSGIAVIPRVSGAPKAACVLDILDRVAKIFDNRNTSVPLVKEKGLVRLLQHILQSQRKVFWLTKSSAPLVATWDGVCV